MPLPSTDRSYWLCQLGGWGVNALCQIGVLLFLLPVLTDAGDIGGVVATGSLVPPFSRDTPWAVIVAEVLALNGVGVLLTHTLRAYLKRHGWDRQRALALVPRVLVAGAIISIPLALLQHWTAVAPLQQMPAGTPLVSQIASHASNWAALVWIWCTLYFLILGSRRRRYAELRESELGRELQAAELRLLKSQLNPHFLFNALNTVRALIADDPPRAQAAVTQLARTLRYTLSANQGEVVALAHELEIVDDYLGIEALRLGGRLQVDRSISADASRARIPVMLLQTVVENAIKHGIAELPEGGTLRIAAELRDGTLSLDVENPRPDGAAPAGEGIGLRNASERLRLLFGTQARLDLDLSAPGRAATRIRIPGAAA